MNTPYESDITELALDYVRRGWSLVPLNGKIPKIKDWTKLPKTTKAEGVEYASGDIGIRTGRISGLVVLDFDPRHGGIFPDDILIPSTPMVKTGSGGRHLYFKYPEEGLRNSVSKLAPGIDVRADGGQVVAPPSIHTDTGQPYEWLVHPNETPLAELPLEILKRLKEDGAKRPATPIEGNIPKGQRNARLTSLAGSMQRRGMSEAAILAALLTENHERCDPPLPDDEVRSIARSVSRYQPDVNSFLSYKGDLGKETNFQPIRAVELLSQVEERIDWAWEMMIPFGVLFLITAFMKVGKTELGYRLAVAVSQGTPFLGMPTRKTGVLILAVEEHPRDVKRRLTRLGMKPEDPFFVHAGRLKNTAPTVAEIRDFIKANGIGLVLVDTVSLFWGLQDENDNQAIIREVSPLLQIARETGAAVGLICHERKTGGEDGRGIRGGSALFGIVDQAIILERRQGGAETQRSLKTLGRYAESPKELIVDLFEGEYRVLGTPAEVGKQAALVKAREVLGPEPRDVKTLASDAAIKEKDARWALEELRKAGDAIREGKGKKGDPFLYRRPPVPDSFRSQPSSIGEETNFVEVADMEVLDDEIHGPAATEAQDTHRAEGI